MLRLLMLPVFMEYNYTKDIDIGLYGITAYRRQQ
jgi:hypothetical protein